MAGVGILVTSLGGQLSNTLFMRPKAVVIELLLFQIPGSAVLPDQDAGCSHSRYGGLGCV